MFKNLECVSGLLGVGAEIFLFHLKEGDQNYLCQWCDVVKTYEEDGEHLDLWMIYKVSTDHLRELKAGEASVLQMQCANEKIWMFEGYYSEMLNLREVFIEDVPADYFSSPVSFLD